MSSSFSFRVIANVDSPPFNRKVFASLTGQRLSTHRWGKRNVRFGGVSTSAGD
jgi:hypothetical protein